MAVAGDHLKGHLAMGLETWSSKVLSKRGKIPRTQVYQGMKPTLPISPQRNTLKLIT